MEVFKTFDESNFASALDIGLRLFGSNKKLVLELSSWGNMKGVIEEDDAHIEGFLLASKYKTFLKVEYGIFVLYLGGFHSLLGEGG